MTHANSDTSVQQNDGTQTDSVSAAQTDAQATDAVETSAAAAEERTYTDPETGHSVRTQDGNTWVVGRWGSETFIEGTDHYDVVEALLRLFPGKL